MTPTGVLSHAETNRSRFLGELRHMLAFPSISSEPERKDDVRRCAAWLACHLRTIGMPRVRLVHAHGHPIVYAETQRVANRPTLMVYGHYDVAPVGRVDAWDNPPFDPSVRGDYLLARGASDDKGQFFTHVKALECFLKCAGRTPVHVKCVFEGEEEIGSPNLLRLLHRHQGLLDSDCVVISDTAMLSKTRPAIVTGLRGLSGLKLEVQGPCYDVHAGTFGGAIHDPWQALCEIVARLHNTRGRVAIPGFYDTVRRIPDSERRDMRVAGWQFDTLLRKAGVSRPWGEPGYTSWERAVLRPALLVHPSMSVTTSKNAGSVVPARVAAQLNFRLVPDQEPSQVEQLTRRYLSAISPPTVSTGVRRTSPGVRPVRMNHANLPMRLATSACWDVFGAKPVFVRSGGTIPVVSAFHHVLRVPTVLMGFGQPDDCKHAPNERFYIPNFFRAIATSIRFMTRLGEISLTDARLSTGVRNSSVSSRPYPTKCS